MRPNRLERAGSLLLWGALPALALALVLGYVALAVCWHANPPVVPVDGTSMRPTLHAGDLVFVRSVPAEELRVGDVIAFRVPPEVQERYGVPGSYVHRIVERERTENGFQFRTKGDNVAGPDPFWTFSDNVVGRLVVHVPGGGYPILFFRSRQGKIFGAALAGVLLLYLLLGVWERRQEAEEAGALTMARIVGEARELRDSMLRLSTSERAPPDPAPAEPAEPAYVPVWQRERRPHLAEFELAPAYRAEATAPPFVPVPNGRALVPRTPPIDVERLERELHESVRTSLEVQETMRELVGAVGEYGEHLRSHTAVMRNLSAATGDLQAATAEMRELLAGLAKLVSELHDARVPDQVPSAWRAITST